LTTEEKISLSRKFPLNERRLVNSENIWIRRNDDKLSMRYTLDKHECGRGISQTNFIVTPTRSPLSINTVSEQLFINLGIHLLSLI
jgi:hypothetical protein